MAVIDYGAILKVNGKFINKNSESLMMKKSDMGYKPKKMSIGGFAMAGDENFCLTFYKGYCEIYHNEKLINNVSNSPFLSETIYNGDLPSVKIEHLDREKQPWCKESYPWREYINTYLFYADDLTEEGLEDVKNSYPKHYMKYLRILKGRKRNNRDRYYTDRWKATWEYKDNKYEVIFGCGIDNNEEVWNRIKYKVYDFTDYERKVINEWFK